MSLAQRVRDFRYSKGWGPDELANRAEISRTALYQIESGKTELPRAGTLRRIAVALNVPMEDLLGHENLAESMHSTTDFAPARSRSLQDWIPAEGGPLAIPGNSSFKGHSNDSNGDESRFTVHTAVHPKTNSHDSVYLREGELMAKLHDLIHSPMGSGVAPWSKSCTPCSPGLAHRCDSQILNRAVLYRVEFFKESLTHGRQRNRHGALSFGRASLRISHVAQLSHLAVRGTRQLPAVLRCRNRSHRLGGRLLVRAAPKAGRGAARGPRTRPLPRSARFTRRPTWWSAETTPWAAVTRR